MADFDTLLKDDGSVLQGTRKRKAEEGQERVWLRVYETLPPQMLNAYGMAKHTRLTDATVWEAMTRPLKSGAKYMTEYASLDKERRGIAANRWLKSLLDFIEYQEKDSTRAQNKALLQEERYTALYAEIELVKPAVAYCLAPKKQMEKTGAASLRSAAMEVVSEKQGKSMENLDKYTKILYDWLDQKKTSRIRMLMMWQAAGGLSYVTSCHHRATQCFLGYGNKKHEGTGDGEVSLSEFQAAIKDRHRIGSSGIDEEAAQDGADWK